jgi:hypothetical protein
MVALSVASCLALIGVAGGAFVTELVAAMAGPLVAVLVSWAWIVRTHRRNPARVMFVMLQSAIAKILFFCVYVIVMVRVLELQPTLFAMTFVGYFLALYATQAIMMRRLFGPVPAAIA